MSAYTDILNNSSISKLKGYRQSLVSERSRGNLISGNLAEAMDVMEKSPNQDPAAVEIAKIFIKTGRTTNPGIILDSRGTEKALRVLEANGKLKLQEDFAAHYLFSKTVTQEKWLACSESLKRRCISRNLEDLNKKTEINYRTHGDRLHYFVVGKVTVHEKASIKYYPLFLFSCNEINKRTLQADIENTGFINFWLDKHVLQDEISKKLKGYEISINENFASQINDVSQLIKTVQPSTIDLIEFDPNYSGICIVTGFEPEFIDPVWPRILQEND